MENTAARVWSHNFLRPRAEPIRHTGDDASTVEVGTALTQVEAHLNSDGSGFINVWRNGHLTHEVCLGPEAEDPRTHQPRDDGGRNCDSSSCPPLFPRPKRAPKTTARR